MSSSYSVTDITHSSIHSDATADLPRICDDSECLYPFGPACDLCSFALDVKEQAKQQSRHTDTVAAWIEEVQINRNITIHAGEEFTGGADAANNAIVIIEKQAAVEEDYVSVGDVVSEPDNDNGYEADEEADFGDARSDKTQSKIHLRSPECAYSDNSSGSTASISFVSLVHEPETLSPWLDTIFDNTLKGQLESTHFTGGADVEQNPDVDNCEFCGKPLGDPTDQHYLKCKYAHEELERVSKWGSAWST